MLINCTFAEASSGASMPLYSFCTVRIDVVPRYVSFAETFGAIWEGSASIQSNANARTSSRAASLKSFKGSMP